MALANNLLDEQRHRNLDSRGQWEAFSAHRKRVTTLLLEAAHGRDQPSLCLLGAGNCNDVDLNQLMTAYARIHLVDCDTESLKAGAERQGLAGHPSLVL